jgi:hypothetical protein
MTNAQFSPHRVMGLAGAAIWLGGIGAFFASLALVFVRTPVARLGILIVVAGLAALVTADVALIRRTRSLGIPEAPRTPKVQAMLRWFKWVVIGEIAAILIVNTICSSLGYYDIISPLDVLIVGLHLFPLAWIFRVPRYYTMGALFCGVVIATLLLVAGTTRIGPVSAWFVVVSLGCGPVAMWTALGNTLEAARDLRGLTRIDAPSRPFHQMS